MPGEKKSVTETDSPTGKKSDTASQERDSALTSDDRPELNVLREKERKMAAELEELKAEMGELKAEREERLSEKEDRLEQLQDKSNLTRRDMEEMATLEEQISAIKRDPRSTAWRKVNDESSEKIAESRVNSFAADLAEEYITELAEKDGIPLEKFERDMVKYMRSIDPVGELNPYKRAKAAYKAYTRDKSLDDKEKKLGELEQKFKESGTQQTSSNQVSAKEFRENALKSKDGMTKYLKAVADRQEEASKR